MTMWVSREIVMKVQTETKKAGLWTEFGLRFAVDRFGEQVVGEIPLFETGPDIGQPRAYIVWDKIVTGGMDHGVLENRIGRAINVRLCAATVGGEGRVILRETDCADPRRRVVAQARASARETVLVRYPWLRKADRPGFVACTPLDAHMPRPASALARDPTQGLVLVPVNADLIDSLFVGDEQEIGAAVVRWNIRNAMLMPLERRRLLELVDSTGHYLGTRQRRIS